MNNKKHITCLIGTLSSGGAEHQLSILTNALVSREYQVTIVSFSDRSDHYPLDPRIERIRIAEGKPTKWKIISLFRYFLTVKTDCVISFSQRCSLLSLPPLFFRKKIKVISGERNITIGKPTTKERILLNYLYKRADYIVPNSRTQGDFLRTISPKLGEKVRVINNFTDLAAFKVSPPPHGDVIRIGVFARFENQKNCHRFVEMLGRLKTKEKKRFIVDWYGNSQYSSPKLVQYVEDLKELIKKSSVEDCFIMHDPVKNVEDLMKSFDAICLPSIYEGFSNAISEGIASGKPMLVSNVSDNSVMVHNGDNGFLFNPFSIDDMLDSFIRFFSMSKMEIDRMGNRSREIAESLFNLEKFVSSYIELIEK